MPERLSDWELRFVRWLAEIAERPHAFGEHDCMVGLVGGAALALTGIDHAAPHRGRYATAREASAYLKAQGFEDCAAFMDALFPRKPVLKAQRGDVVLDDDGIPAVVLGGEAAMIGKAGLVRIPRAQWDAERAWSL